MEFEAVNLNLFQEETMPYPRKVEGIRGEFQNLNAYRRKNSRPI
tara:strand:+ start:1216 stop:1347 length:132 start_codon:yes stop_codon:yes gene_type:complete